ncbi:MAG: hypothetical protein V4722_26890 [Bacteroidota bacterium]
MKPHFIITTALALFCSIANAQNVGINTTLPNAALDVNGDIIFRPANLVVADGITLSLDVNLSKYSYYRVAGPTADFTIAGIAAGIDGRLLTLFNRSGFTMQLNNEDATAAITDMIVTGTGADLTIVNKGIVNLQYDGDEGKWIVKSSSKAGGGMNTGGWDTTGQNIFFNTTGNVGIGTETPGSKLTVQTDLNSTGITHVGGVDEIILASKIGAGAASFGTETANIFSLNSGGAGKVHVWPSGNVVIGDLSGGPTSPNRNNPNSPNTVTDEPLSKLTIITPINSTGWNHIGQVDGVDSIIVGEGIGGVSAALGTSTNHAFRLTAGTLGRVSLYPGGEMVVGPNATGAFGKLTVATTNNTYGISHLGEAGNILATRMGGTSAGIGTFSDTHMRIFANSVSAITITGSTGNVGIGTEFQPYKLAVNGTIRAKEIRINTGWADYVFAKNYKLMPLAQVEQYIKNNQRLPGIASAKKLQKEGVGISEMQTKMMAKIEELTLYMIEANKTIEILKQRLDEVQNINR